MKNRRIGPDGAFLREFTDVRKRVESLETRPAGSVVIRDTLTTTDPETGVKTVFGQLPDGSYGIQEWVGDTTPPPMASMTMVRAQPGLISVVWDGEFEGGEERPRDFKHVNLLARRKIEGTSDYEDPIHIGVLKDKGALHVSTDVIAVGERVRFTWQSEDFSGNLAEESYYDDTVMMESIMSDVKITEKMAELVAEDVILKEQAEQAQEDATAAQVLADAIVAKGVNLAVNGDFDLPITTPVSGWPVRTLAYVEAHASARSGGQIMRAAPTSTTAYAYTDYVDTAKDRTYLAEMWIRLSATAPAPTGTIGFYFSAIKLDGSSNVDYKINDDSFTAANLSTSSYTKVKVKYTIPVDSTKVRFGPRLTGSGNVYLIDNFKVIDITAAETAQIRADQAFSKADQAAEAAGIAQDSADGKSTNWYQNEPPAGIGHRNGDTWFDTNDDNRIYVWNANTNTWQNMRDKAIDALAEGLEAAQGTADGKNTTYYTATAPTGGTYRDGDLWFDSSKGNSPNRYKAGVGWQSIQDLAISAANSAATGAQFTADGKNKSYYVPTAPSDSPSGTLKTGDMWFDTSNGYKLSTWTGTAWQTTQDAALALTTASAKGRTYTQNVTPPVEARLPQNLWVDTSLGLDKAVTKYWDGTTWTAVSEKAAKDAADLANAKGETIYSSTEPAAAKRLAQNLWIDTTGGININKRWDGSGWVVVADSRISSTATAVTAADSKAQTALDEAIAKSTIYTQNVTPPTSARLPQTVWNDTSLGLDKVVVKYWSSTAGAWTPIVDKVATEAKTTADAKGETIFSSTAPVAAKQLSQNLWIDTTGGINLPKRWNGSGWVNVTDKVATDAAAAAAAADSKAVAAQNAANTADGKAVTAQGAASVADGKAVDALNAAVAKGQIYTQSVTPPVEARLPQNLWVDTSLGLTNTVTKYWNGSAWTAIADKAATDAATAAGSKSKILYQTSAPTGADANPLTLWIDTTGGANTPKKWVSGTTWASITDKAATDAAAAASVAMAAQSYSNNASFDDWTGSYPVGYAQWSSSAIVKETSIVRRAPYALRFNVLNSTNQYGVSFQSPLAHAPNLEYFTVEVDLYLVSGTLDGSGMILDWNGLSNNRAQINFASEITNPVTGKWYRISKVLRRPTNSSGTWASMGGYLMAQWTGHGAGATKEIIYDWFNIRPSTTAEILAYTAPTTSDVTTAKTDAINTAAATAQTKADTAQAAAIAAAATDATTKSNNAETAAKSAAATDAQNKADAAQAAAVNSAATDATNKANTAKADAIAAADTAAQAKADAARDAAIAAAATDASIKATNAQNAASALATTAQAAADKALASAEAYINNGTSTAGIVVKTGAAPTVVTSDTAMGGKALQKTGAAHGWWEDSSAKMAYDPTVLYRVSARVRVTASATSGGKGFYFGFVGFLADGVTYNNASNANSYSSQQWTTQNAQVTPDGNWVDYVGYYKGVSTGNTSGAGTILDPKKVSSNTRYVTPGFILDYNTGNGTWELSHFSVQVVDSAGAQALVDAENARLAAVAADTKAANAQTSATTANSAAAAAQTAANNAQTTANSAQTSANGKNRTYYQGTMPTGGTYITGDTWFDTSNGYKIYVHNGTTFVASQDAAIGTAQTTANSALTTANSKTKTFVQSGTPTATTVGDIWIDTANGNVVKTWEGSSWVTRADAAIAAAQTAANTAQTSANGKNKTYSQVTMPTGGTYIAGDTWFDTANGNKIFVHNGTTFVAAQDTNILLSMAGAFPSEPDSAAANKWLYSKYTSTYPSTTLPTYAHLIGRAATTSLISDGATLVNSVGDNYMGMLRTIVNVATTKTISFTATHDDSGHILVDGQTVYAKAAYTAGASISFELTAGTHVLDLLWTEQAGGDGWFGINPTIGSQVTSMFAPARTGQALDAAYSAQSAATTAQTSANGKNKVIWSTSAASGTSYAAGDTWFQRDGNGAVIAQWEFTTSWQSRTVSEAVLGNLSAGKITSGTIAADRIGAGTISASKLLVTDMEELIPNPFFHPNAEQPLMGTIVANTATGVPAGCPNPYALLFNSRDNHPFSYPNIPVKTGDQFYVEVWVASATTAIRNFNLYMFGSVTPTGGLTAKTAVGNIAPTQTWTKVVMNYTVPSGFNYIRPVLQINTSGGETAGQLDWYATGFSMRRKNTGQLIVDGAIQAGSAIIGTGAIGTAQIGNAQITTAKIADLAVTDAQIASATITNAKIANLDAAKITTGTLDAGRIGADSITATHIAANAITTDELAAGSITAAKGQLADAAITTAKIADAQITTAKITNLAVDNAKIANLAITDAKINDLHASKINAGTIAADRIGANTITAGKLNVTLGGNNLLPNSSFEAYTGTNGLADNYINFTRGTGDAGRIYTNTITAGLFPGSTRAQKVAFSSIGNTEASALQNTQLFSVEAGQVITISLYARANKAMAVTPAIRCEDNGGVYKGDALFTANLTTTTGRYSGQVTLPAGTTRGKFTLTGAAAPVNGDWFEVDGIQVEIGDVVSAWGPMTSELLPGTIKAEHLAANSIAVGTAAIQSGTIIDAHISTLDATKIKTGTLDANRIGANSITADKLLVTDRTNFWENPTFEGDTIGQRPAGTWNGACRVIGSGASGSGKSLEIDAYSGSNNDVYGLNTFEVQPGDKYFLTAEAKYLNTTGTGWGKLGFRTFGPTKAGVTWTGVVNWTAKSTSFNAPFDTAYSGVYTVPAGTYYLQPWISFGNNGETTNKFHIDNIIIRRMNGGELIVDGAIKATSLSASALDGKVITGSTVQTHTGTTTGIKLTSSELVGYDGSNQKTFSLSSGGSLALKGELQSGSTITGARLVGTGIETSVNATSGVKIKDSGIITYDGSGNMTFKVDSATGLVEAPGLKANSIKGDKIEAGSISADRLLISDFTNLLDDPLITGTGWTKTSGASGSSLYYSPNEKATAWKFAASSMEISVTNNNVIPVSTTTSDSFQLAFRGYNSSNASGYLRAKFYNESMAEISFTDLTMPASQAFWASYTRSVTVPTGAKFMKVQAIVGSNMTSGDMYFSLPTVRRRNGGELIVDGAISATSLSATALNGQTITGSTVQTSPTASTGIKLTSTELAGWSNPSTKTFSLTSAGALTLKGDIQSGSTITGARLVGAGIETSNNATSGVKIKDSGITAYDAANNLTFKVDAATGLVEAPGLKANSITGDMIAGQTITAKNLYVADFDNLATIDELNNRTVSSYGQTQIVSGYNKLVTDSGAYLMFTDQRGPVPFAKDDTLYYEFTAKATSATTVQFGVWTYDATTNSSTIGAAVSVGTSDTLVKGELKVTSYKTNATQFTLGLASVSGKGIQVKGVKVYKKYGGNLIVDGAIDGKIITGATVQTDTGATTGIKLTSSELAGWDGTNKNFSLTSGGALTLKGDIQSGSTITGARLVGSGIETSNSATSGVKITSSGIKAYDTGNNLTFSVDAATGEVEAPGIKANSIKGDVIAAGTMSIDKLTVGDFSNLILSATNASVSAGWRIENATLIPTTASTGLPAFKLTKTAGGSEARAFAPYVDVKPGEKIRLSYMTEGDWDSGNAAIYGTGLDKNGAYVAFSPGTSGASTPGDKGPYIFTIPDNMVKLSLRPYISSGTSGGKYATFSNVEARRMVGGELIVDGAIKSINIATEGLDAGVIKTGYLGSNLIDAGSITTDKLVTGLGTNLIPDPNFVQPNVTAMRNTASNMSSVVKNNTTGNLDVTMSGTGSYYFRPTGVAQSATEYTRWIPVKPGETYVFSATVTTGAGGSGDLRMTGRTQDGVNYSTSFNTASTFKAFSAGTTTLSYVAIVPADCFWMLPEIRFSGFTGTANILPNSLSLRQQTGGELIATGGVVTSHMTSGTIDAGVLVAKSIKTNHIDSGAITTRTIGVGDFTNIAAGGNFDTATELANWSANFPGVVSIDAGTYDTGVGSLKVTGGVTLTLDSLTTVRPGDQFDVSLRYKTDASYNGTSGNAKLRFGDRANNHLTSFTYTNVNAPWTTVNGAYTVPATGVDALQLSLVFNHTAGTIWIDNVTVRKKVGVTLIEDDAITTGKIKAGAIDATKLSANSVTASAVSSKSITVDKLVVSSTNNLIIEPDFTNNGASWTTNGTTMKIEPTAGRGGNPALRFSGTTLNLNSYNLLNKIPVEANNRFRVSVWVKSTEAVAANGIKLAMRRYTTATAQTAWTMVANSAPLVPNTWTEISGISPELPSTIVALDFYVIVANPTSAAVTDIDSVSVTRAMSSNLVVDGAITASSLTTNMVLTTTITAGNPTGTHAEMTPSGFRVFAAGAEAGAPATEVVRLGVADTNDYFAITKSDGSLAATISQDGVGAFGQLNATNSFHYKGKELQYLLDKSGRGILNSAYRTTDAAVNAVAGGPWVPYLRVEATLENNRHYRIWTSSIRIDTDNNTTGSVAIGYRNDGTNATATNSTLLTQGHVQPSGGGRGTVTLAELYAKPGTEGGTHLASFIILQGVTGGSGAAGIRAGGTYPVRLVIEDVGLPDAGSNGVWLDGTTPPPPATQNYVKQYSCTNSMNYQGNNAQYNFDTGRMYQGLSPAGYGNLKSVGLWNRSSVMSDLSGATINYVRVYFNFGHWYYNSGGTARIGLHAHTGIPGTFTGMGPMAVISGGWPKPGARWIDIPSTYWNGFKDGSYSGGVYLEGDSTYTTYGYADRPTLEIGYTK